MEKRIAILGAGESGCGAAVLANKLGFDTFVSDFGSIADNYKKINNGELFKVPIYWGCLMGSVYFLTNNHTNYKRFKRIYGESSLPDNDSPINGETAKYYRDAYRRYRDYSIVATAAFYLLQVIDANVFAYMHDFEVTDDISMNVEPALISPYNEYAMNVGPVARPAGNAVGMRVGIRF